MPADPDRLTGGDSSPPGAGSPPAPWRPDGPASAWRPDGIAPFLAALVLYIGLGLTLKSAVLNWVVGPVFPVLVLYVLPRALERATRSRSR